MEWKSENAEYTEGEAMNEFQENREWQQYGRERLIHGIVIGCFITWAFVVVVLAVNRWL